MKAKLILITIAILIIVGAGCPINSGKDGTSMEQYRKGTVGLEAKFAENVKTIPENTKFRIGFEISNKGPYDIEQAYLSVEADEYIDISDSNDFTLVEGNPKMAITKPLDFAARTPSNPAGGRTYLFLNAESKSALDKPIIESEIKAHACYSYDTIVTVDVCIDPKQYQSGFVGDSPCAVKEISLTGGQGAPVAVTKIKPVFLYEGDNVAKPYFEITLENLGTGDVFERSKSTDIKSACTGEELGKRWNRIAVFSKFLVDNKIISCDVDQEDYTTHLREKTVTVTCTGDPISMDLRPYKTPLIVHLLYGYVYRIEEKIGIMNIRTGSCEHDFPAGSVCNDVENTDCGESVPGQGIAEQYKGKFNPKPIPTKDCAYGCCVVPP